MPSLRMLVVLLLMCGTHATAAADLSPRQLLRSTANASDACASVLEISAFVSAHCNSSSASTPLDARCSESFSEFARDSDVFSACEARMRSADAALVRAFKVLYTTWQQARVCEQFHARERQAARDCAGDNVHRPWNEATWPLFCHETFTSYGANRKELDALCARTADSPAFWEGYADYIASPTCKTYYDYVRAAAKRDCGTRDSASECVTLFEWYREHQSTVETECLELHNTKPFYRGFYRWKRSVAP